VTIAHGIARIVLLPPFATRSNIRQFIKIIQGLTHPGLEAANAACLIVSNLQDGKVSDWDHAGGNHEQSTYHGCAKPPTNVNAPGTDWQIFSCLSFCDCIGACADMKAF
jgi:hypothetical protein